MNAAQESTKEKTKRAGTKEELRSNLKKMTNERNIYKEMASVYLQQLEYRQRALETAWAWEELLLARLKDRRLSLSPVCSVCHGDGQVAVVIDCACAVKTDSVTVLPKQNALCAACLKNISLAGERICVACKKPYNLRLFPKNWLPTEWEAVPENKRPPNPTLTSLDSSRLKRRLKEDFEVARESLQEFRDAKRFLRDRGHDPVYYPKRVPLSIFPQSNELHTR